MEEIKIRSKELDKILWIIFTGFLFLIAYPLFIKSISVLQVELAFILHVAYIILPLTPLYKLKLYPLILSEREYYISITALVTMIFISSFINSLDQLYIRPIIVALLAFLSVLLLPT